MKRCVSGSTGARAEHIQTKLYYYYYYYYYYGYYYYYYYYYYPGGPTAGLQHNLARAPSGYYNNNNNYYYYYYHPEGPTADPQRSATRAPLRLYNCYDYAVLYRAVWGTGCVVQCGVGCDGVGLRHGAVVWCSESLLSSNRITFFCLAELSSR